MANMNDVSGGFIMPPITFTSGAFSGATAAAGVLSGQGLIVANSTTNGGNWTTRTATQMISDSQLALGQTWWVIIANSGAAGTLTLVAGGGVTVAGTATIATIVARLFVAQVTAIGTPAITFTGLAISFSATALLFAV